MIHSSQDESWRRGQRRREEWKRKQMRLETKEAHSFPEAAIEVDLDEKAIQSKGEFNFSDL